MRTRTAAALLAGLATLLPGCVVEAGTEKPTVVASFYPLAFAAERIAGPGWNVIDLTPPGSEAHDIELSLEDRAALERAELVVYLGDIGFQPQVEDAIAEADGETVAVNERVSLGAGDDPHMWLWPSLYLTGVADVVQVALWETDPGNTAGYTRRFTELSRELEALEADYDRVLGSGTCRYRTLIVSHEAFGYLIRPYNLEQFGLAGLSPEGEPTHDRRAQAQRLIRQGGAGAVFFEPGEESERIVRSVADDAGVPALPLSTLESRPPEGNYLTVMRDNLASLREGLGCR